jgi:DNA-binding MarR family transcriptional regulator
MSGRRTSAHKQALDRIVETSIYLQTESRRLAREQCDRLGITATQLSVLKMLEQVGDLSLSQLSKRMATTNSTVTGIVDRMVAAKLVAREQDTDDRRVWRIRLTSDGRGIASKIRSAPWDMLRAAVMALPAAELEQLVATLAKVADHVDKMIAKESR